MKTYLKLPETTDKHAGIRIDKIHVSDSLGGMLFALSTLAVLVIGLPGFRTGFLVTAISGLAVGVGIYFWRRQTRW